MTGNGRAVVLTGASRGIGRACTVRLARAGFRVFAGVRSADDGRSLARELGDEVTPVPLDVTRPDSIARAAETVGAAVADRGVWGLVNNAGIVVGGPLEFLPPDALRTQFDVNVFGLVAVTQAFLPLLRAGRGRIVNVSSVNGRLAAPFSGAYAASKFALEALSDALRLELSDSGIAVVVIQPGAVDTPIWDASRERASSLLQGYPPQARTYYATVLDRLDDARTPGHAVPADAVAAVVERALSVRRPRTRYRVGWDARAGVLLARLLPGRVIDWILRVNSRWID